MGCSSLNFPWTLLFKLSTKVLEESPDGSWYFDWPPINLSHQSSSVDNDIRVPISRKAGFAWYGHPTSHGDGNIHPRWVRDLHTLVAGKWHRGVSLLNIPSMVIYFPLWKPDIAMEIWTSRWCISLFNLKNFHSYLGFPRTAFPPVLLKSCIKNIKLLVSTVPKISEILEKNRTCARSIQTPRGMPKPVCISADTGLQKSGIIKTFHFAGGSSLIQIYEVSLDAFSLNTSLVWVGNTMNTQNVNR